MDDKPRLVTGAERLMTNKAEQLAARKRTTVSRKSIKAIESGNVQDVIESLSPRQKVFCEEYLVDMNATQAVLRAGYQTNNPKQMGFQLMENPAVRIAIDGLRAERAAYSSVTKDFVLRKIVKTLEKAEVDNNHNATLRAAELLARHLGMFIERTEISGPDGEAIRYEKAKEDAADFISSISSLAKRNGA